MLHKILKNISSQILSIAYTGNLLITCKRRRCSRCHFLDHIYYLCDCFLENNCMRCLDVSFYHANRLGVWALYFNFSVFFSFLPSSVFTVFLWYREWWSRMRASQTRRSGMWFVHLKHSWTFQLWLLRQLKNQNSRLQNGYWSHFQATQEIWSQNRSKVRQRLLEVVGQVVHLLGSYVYNQPDLKRKKKRKDSLTDTYKGYVFNEKKQETL